MKRGFTLVELLVVLAVITVLVSVGVAGYSAIRKDAADAQGRSMVASLTSALNRYYGKNNEYPLASDLFGGSPNGSAPSNYNAAANVLSMNTSNFKTSSVYFLPCSINMGSTAPGSSCSYGYYGTMAATDAVRYITKDIANNTAERSYIVQSPNGPGTSPEYCEIVFRSDTPSRSVYVMAYWSNAEYKVKFVKSSQGEARMYSPESGQCVFTAL